MRKPAPRQAESDQGEAKKNHGRNGGFERVRDRLNRHIGGHSNGFNQFIACGICDTEFNLRMQMDVFDIPFNFNYPKCKTHIYGSILAEKVDEPTPGNARLLDVETVDVTSEYYVVALSAVF